MQVGRGFPRGGGARRLFQQEHQVLGSVETTAEKKVHVEGNRLDFVHVPAQDIRPIASVPYPPDWGALRPSYIRKTIVHHRLQLDLCNLISVSKLSG